MCERICTSIFGCLLFIIINAVIFTISYNITEYKQARTYVENVCQVTNSDIDNSSCIIKSYQSCYQPVWAVLYDKPNINDEPIQGEIFYPNLIFLSEAIQRVQSYQIGHIYKCYHDQDNQRVIWQRPDKRTPLIILCIGLGMITIPIICCCSLILWCYCQTKKKTSSTSNQPISTIDTPQADSYEMEKMTKSENDPSTLSTSV